MRESRNPGVYMYKDRFYTVNLVPGAVVYGEKLFKENGREYREWDTRRSKVAAAISKNITQIGVKENDVVLYLGSSSGTTLSHISDIVGKNGFVFGIDIAPRMLRDLVFLAEKRKNIAPILADCNHPEQYNELVCECDCLIQDIAQRNQVEIFFKNLQFLKKGGFALLTIKARSIDVTKNPVVIFDSVRKELEQKIKVVDYKRLDPLEKDHCIFLCRKE